MPPTPPQGGSPGWPQDQPPSPDSFFNRRRWVIIGLSLVVVVAVVLGLTVWKASSQRLGGPGSTSDGDVDRTVGLLREKDPVCDEWGKYADELAAKTQEWASIDDEIPASNWSPDQRDSIETAAVAISYAADHFESILPMASNTALQELIAQVIVYWRAYINTIPTYVEADGKLSGVASNFGNAVTFICTAVSPMVEATIDSERKTYAANADDLTPFMTTPDGACDDLLTLIERQNALLRTWTEGDLSLPASEWSSEQRRLNLAAREVLTRDFEQVRHIAESVTNAIFSDLLFTYSAYLQAFADSIPTYTSDDDQLWKIAIYLAGGLGSACEATP